MEKRARVAVAEDHAFAGDFVAAAACMREACEDDPADPELWFLQGYYQAQAGLLDEAARSLGEALAIDPDHGLAHHVIANCLRDLGQSDPAANHYRRALEQLDDDAAAVADFGLHHLRCGDVDLAAALFRRALELDPDCELACRGLEATVPLQGPTAVAQPPESAVPADESPPLAAEPVVAPSGTAERPRR
ncbi:MAG: tetratricopeptide repeat protein, partial [Candidatus Sericytochromatia bacterium]|nr:tetratricopeptide repeat protein [Candidatus Tanganyikabacteria bacterium]